MGRHSPQARTTSGRGVVLATCLDSRGLCYCRRRCAVVWLDGDGRGGTPTRLAGLAKTDMQTVLARASSPLQPASPGTHMPYGMTYGMSPLPHCSSGFSDPGRVWTKLDHLNKAQLIQFMTHTRQHIQCESMCLEPQFASCCPFRSVQCMCCRPTASRFSWNSSRLEMSHRWYLGCRSWTFRINPLLSWLRRFVYLLCGGRVLAQRRRYHFIVRPTMSSFADASKCRHVTFIIIE